MIGGQVDRRGDGTTMRAFFMCSFKRLAPLLVLYLIIIAVFWRSELVDDEERYVYGARNLVAGQYAELGMRLWSGPGYPLVLTPFVVFGIPIRLAVLLNAVFLFLSAVLIRETARAFMSEQGSLVLAYALGLYAPLFPEMVSILTEPLAVLLASCFAYCMGHAVRRSSSTFSIVSGVCLGALALTKIMYGYVITTGLVLAAVLSTRFRPARRIALMCVVALVCCAPYLAYTYAVTGRPFYWGNSGGLSLYWLSTPHATQYGDWKSPKQAVQDSAFRQHHELFSSLMYANYVKRDDVLRKEAMKNFRRRPGKAVFNWAMNLSRLWFCFPNTNKLQRPHTLGYMLFNSALLAALVLCIYPIWHSRRHIPAELWVIIAFAAIALGGSSFLSAVPRMLNPIVPAFFVVIGYTFGQLVEVHLKPNAPEADTPTGGQGDH